MNRLLTCTAVMAMLTVPATAHAQHADHPMPPGDARATNPHAGHAMPAMAPADAPDPHAGHAMPSMPPANVPDPHAGHAMPPQPAQGPARDPHADHAMPMKPARGSGPHAGHDTGNMTEPPKAAPPKEAFSGPAHAADSLFDPAVMAASREKLRAEQGGMITHKVMIDRLEATLHDGRDGYRWDGQAWYGGDIDKLWLESEGEATFGEQPEHAELQALWSRAITPWFEFQVGGRYDLLPGKDTGHLVLGVQGLAPYFFEVEAKSFLSHRGDLTARLEVEYDQLISQRLVLQPRVEAELSAQDIPETGMGAGLSSIEAGLRLRYEVVPEFAPYIGVQYERKIGNTADFARDEGEKVEDVSFLVGLRLWF